MLIKLNKKSITKLKYEIELIAEWFYKINTKCQANIDESKITKLSTLVNRYIGLELDDEIFQKLIYLDFQITNARSKVDNNGYYLMILTEIKDLLKEILELIERRL